MRKLIIWPYWWPIIGTLLGLAQSVWSNWLVTIGIFVALVSLVLMLWLLGYYLQERQERD